MIRSRILKIYRDKRGDGSTMTLFWLLFGIFVVSLTVFLLGIFLPRDSLRGYVAGSPNLYFHFREPSRFAQLFSDKVSFLQREDVEEAAIIANDASTTMFLVRISNLQSHDALLATEGFYKLSGDIYAKGSKDFFLDSPTTQNKPLALWPISGEIFADGEKYHGVGNFSASRAKILFSRSDTPFIESSVIASLSSCSYTKATSLSENYAWFGSTLNLTMNEQMKKVLAEQTISLVFADILDQAERFSAYENPAIVTARDGLTTLFLSSGSTFYTRDNETIVTFHNVSAVEAKDAILSYVRASLPIESKKVLPDGTTVQEFTLSPEAYAWSEPNERGMSTLVSNNNGLSLALWYKNSDFVLATSSSALQTFLQQKDLVSIKKLPPSLFLHLNDQTPSTVLNSTLSTFDLSSFYAHRTVDNSIIICGLVE